MIWIVPALYLAALLLVLRAFVAADPRLPDYEPVVDGPPLTVIVPARNEARNIEPCVTSILASRYRRLEVIVVDDRSSDDTADRVERLLTRPGNGDRLRLLRGAEVPEGWFGKQWALVQGYRAARPGRSELLLFADADTRHTPDLIPRAVAVLAREKVDLVTLLPRQAMETFWELVIQPHVFFAMRAVVGGFRRLNRTRVPWRGIANGQFILTPRKTYEAVGTHAAVRHLVTDDLALAQAYVTAGRDIFLVDAVREMTTRMYATLGEIVGGWSKNLAQGAPLMMPPIGPLRAVVPWVMWVPSLAWIVPPVLLVVTGSPPWIAVVAISVLLWALVYRLQRVPVWGALVYPLGALMFVGILIRSAVRGRRIEWRGRVYGATPAG